MNHLALYRKYRPSTFDEFYGQKFIVDIVKNSIIKDKLSHAYLFSGPRGTGKTSMAKLIAKIVNCSNLKGVNACDECSSCVSINNKSNPDVIEIDAASNNGVDEIRELRDKVSLMPSISKYKIYIIDEVHMLTISAFNALLKTLEEPPAHVIFILATTELYKVPETIVSRCQTFEFERISDSEIANCLNNICKREDIKVDSNVLELIANYSKGGLRDSIGILDKLASCSDNITSDLFYEVIGVVDYENVDKLISLIKESNISNCLKLLDNLAHNGKNLSYLIEQTINRLKSKVIRDDFDNKDFLILSGLNDILNDIKYSSNYLISLEIGIMNIIFKFNDDQIISREIISDDVKKEDKQHSSNVNNSDIDNKKIISSVSDENNSLDIADNTNDLTFGLDNSDNIEKSKHNFVDDIGINNAFALANKKLKNEMLKKWKDFNDYVHNKEFSSVVSYFLDSTLEVAGEKDVIISLENDAIVMNSNYNKTKLELLFNLVMGKFYNIVFVSFDYFEELKNKYISDIKSGKKYNYIEKFNEKDDIIQEEQVITTSNAFESAKDIFGSDIVEIK